MPFLTIDNQRLFYTRNRGPSSEAPALLLLHGAAGSHLDWPPELRRLPDVATYSLDLPGHGRSEPPGRNTIEGYADVVQQFVQALDLQKTVIAGHSMGGAIAQVLGLRRPAEVIGLVLVGSGARLRVMDAILQQTLTDFPAVVQTISDHVWAPDVPVAIVELGRQRMAAADPQVVLGDFQACNQFDIMEQLDTITLPTLVISATADQMAPLKYGQYLAEHLPHARLVTIEGGGHMMTLEQPQQVASAVQGFINEIE